MQDESLGPKRVREFMPFARVMVEGEPGLTAKEVYRRARAAGVDMDLILSDSKNPLNSLASTLRKECQSYDMERWKAPDRLYRFYPEGYQRALIDDYDRSGVEVTRLEREIKNLGKRLVQAAAAYDNNSLTPTLCGSLSFPGGALGQDFVSQLSESLAGIEKARLAESDLKKKLQRLGWSPENRHRRGN